MPPLCKHSYFTVTTFSSWKHVSIFLNFYHGSSKKASSRRYSRERASQSLPKNMQKLGKSWNTCRRAELAERTGGLRRPSWREPVRRLLLGWDVMPLRSWCDNHSGIFFTCRCPSTADIIWIPAMQLVCFLRKDLISISSQFSHYKWATPNLEMLVLGCIEPLLNVNIHYW